MTASKVGLVALPVVWMALVTASPNAEQTKSVVNGVYTEAQATRGAAAYKKDCSSCHGEGLDGDGFAPGLAGSEFLSNWNGTTVGDLLQAKADIIAHVLKSNKYPAGKDELPSEGGLLKEITLELPK